MSKAFRMSRIFRQDTGNTILLPVDHGILGEMKGLENPLEVLARMIPLGLDGILMNHGIRMHSEPLFYGRNAPARILSADTFYRDETRVYHDLIALPEMALKAGCDCVKVLLFWNCRADEHMQNIKMIADFIREAEKCHIPVMVEPLTLDPISDGEDKVKILTDATRIAYELGADILKVVYPGDPEIIGQWVQKFKVPLIVLGGGLSGGIEELIQMVQQAVSRGVRGAAIGRNVWQRPVEESKLLMQRFIEVIHDK